MNIDGANVTLQDTPSVITVTEGENTHEGKVRLTNSAGRAINKYDSRNYFGGWSDNGPNEYFCLFYGVNKLDMPDKVEGVSPSGTVINMFDYWTGERWPTSGDFAEGNQSGGINTYSPLKFTRGNVNGDNDLNKWTGSEAVRAGIVQNKLVASASGGSYPVLSTNYDQSTSSLAYLFNPANEEANEYRKTFRNVKGLLQVSEDGYYCYDSKQNFAELNEDTKQITLYNNWGVYSNSKSYLNGQFFPFNKYEEVALDKSISSRINHYFGMTLTARFIQRYDGYTDSSRKNPMTFEFSGDDDVWIFVDDVLVADLGGIHDAAHVKINFADGSVVINEGKGEGKEVTTTLQGAFNSAGTEPAGGWSEDTDGNGKSDTFANNTYHTLKFFYLERGNYDSNLYLKYNLSSYPPTGVYKVNQNGDVVSDAEFKVYKANSNYEIIDNTPAYTGKTDDNGQMVFVDEDDMPYTLTELKNMFGEYFVLKETSVPAGYRMVDDEIKLHIKDNILLCENTKESGVWPSPNLQVSAPNTVYLNTPYNGSNIVDVVDESQNENGKIFAVVLKYIGNRDAAGNATELSQQASWAPVYGNNEDGFKVVNVSDFGTDPFSSFINAVIDTAKKYTESHNVFSLSASGAMEGGLDGMPGDISNYYYMLPAGEKEKTEYTIAYYWTSVNSDSLEGANDSNTRRIDADGTLGGETYKFDRVFGATINVANLINRLLVQKLGEDGKLANDAVFAMYKVQEQNSKIYYIADDNILISLAKDEDRNNEGAATLENGTEGTYTVDESTGVIVVEAGGTSYNISPATNANGESLCQTTQYLEDAKEDGTAIYSYILPSQYYIREISAPAGYTLNTTEVMALVTENAIYANAGTANDGVTVARGPGYLIKNMHQFASKGDIDNTLTWIYTKLKVSGESTKFSDVTKENYASWQYMTNAAFLEYNPGTNHALFDYQLSANTRVDSNLPDASNTRRLYTDIGWSYLEIYQNYSYGQDYHVAGAKYEDWSGSDISNLFSRSVYIQVTDEQLSKLKISKTVAGNENETNGFTFRVNLYEKDGTTPLSKEYNYTIYSVNNDGDDNEISTGTISNEGSIQLSDGQYAVISNLPSDAKYTVTETRNPEYAITAMRDNVSVELGVYQDGIVTGDLTWKTVDNVTTDTSTVDFTNTYLPDIEILKVQAGNNETKLKGAEFVLYYKVTNDSVTTNYYYQDGNWVTLTDTVTENNVKLTSNEDGKIKFNNIADGVYYLKELTAPDGYKLLDKEIVITVKNGVIASAQDFGGTTTYSADDTGKILSVPNSAGIKLPDTGGEGTDWYTYSGLLLIVVALMCGYIMRRKDERRGKA